MTTSKKPIPSRRGRPKTFNSDEERRQAQKDYQKGYNSVRKAKYHSDPDYRNKVKKRSIHTYAKRVANYHPKRYGRNLGKATEFAIDGVLSWYKMAQFLMMERRVFGLWVRSGRFPPGNRGSAEAGENSYTPAYAEALAEALDGLRGRRSFRKTDTAIIKRLYAIKPD